ncbi:MAG: heterodisulfide reductase-related iron-sulfur binding cluster [Promethearchaeota archaeon]
MINIEFNSSYCSDCEGVDCLMRCMWINFDSIEEARAEQMKMINGENSRVLSECVTCFACNEYCPHDVKPYYMRVKLMEKYNSHNINEAIKQSSIKRYQPHDEVRLKEIDPEKPVLNKCAFVKTNAKNMEGKLFENLQYVAGLDYFCNLLYHHLDLDTIVLERAQIILDNIKKQGIREMICFHDECYALYKAYLPAHGVEVPFKPVHLFEYIYNYLKEHESEITKLNLKMAYQRNCSNRSIPETDKWVDKICDLIGVERVARQYDRENALCCAAPFNILGKRKLVRETQNKNVEDMIAHGAEVCAFNCPMCMETMGAKVERKGIKPYLLSDLCRMALGEKIE